MAKIRLITGGEDHWRHRLQRIRQPLYSVDEMRFLVCNVMLIIGYIIIPIIAKN